MYRPPGTPQRSPGPPRPQGRFPSPGWAFPGARSPYGASPRGGAAHSPAPAASSPVFSPRSGRGQWDGSPVRFGGGGRGFGGNPRYRGDGFRQPRPFSHGSSPKFQFDSPGASIEKYFSPSMMQDPWAELQPAGNRAQTNRSSSQT